MRSTRCLWGAGLVAGALVVLSTLAPPPPPARPAGVEREVIATGVPRPLQLVVDGSSLVVLSPGLRGDAAAEIFRVELDGRGPADLGRRPRVRVPFVDRRMGTLGSLAIAPGDRALFLGEENGRRVWRLRPDGTLDLYADGLHRLVGGGTLTFDPAGRLLLVDYVEPRGRDEDVPPGLEPFRDEDYRGPLVFRLALEPDVPLPRHVDRLAPLFPRGWGGKAGGGLLPRIIAALAPDAETLVLMTSSGDLLRLAGDVATPFARLPRGQYNRTHLIAAPDGGLFVSGGFHVGGVYRVRPDGAVSVVAENLADPEGIALHQGRLYVAESSLHRIVRLRLD